MNKIKLTNETSYITDEVAPHADNALTNNLRSEYSASERRRHRYCFHQNPSVDLHDIVITYDKTAYIPPNKHIGKCESLLVLSGSLEFFLFTESGEVYDFKRISTPQSGLPFYLRVPPNTWHGIRVTSDEPCIVKETISGPYSRLDLQWADFAPSESEGAPVGLSWYDSVKKKYFDRLTSAETDEIFQPISENLFRSTRQLITVSLSQLEPIVAAAKRSSLHRARLCCHNSTEDKLQEMFIALTFDVSIAESVHIRKDESLTVINGSGRYLFLNEDGSIRSSIKLSSYPDSMKFEGSYFARINRYISHKIEVDSPVLLIHEATSGPFFRDHTDYRIEGINE